MVVLPAKTMAYAAQRLPEFLKKRRPFSEIRPTRLALRRHRLNTVCEEARCPNIGECFSKPTATFLILGDVCTRTCRFCSIAKGKPLPVDPGEPLRIAEAAQEMSLRHVVVTSVDRDDLPDGGASHFLKVIEALRSYSPETTIEILTPDFQGSRWSLDKILAVPPDIFNHNLETVPSLYRRVRPRSCYERSLGVLEYVKERRPRILTKSGMMLGLGEKKGEVFSVLKDLRAVDCDIVTLGQYLQPTRRQLPVREFVRSETYEEYQNYGIRLGIRFVVAGPFVRSSYNAERVFHTIRQNSHASISTH